MYILQKNVYLLLLLLNCFSHVRFCATPQKAAHQALPSLGFSRQEHWSGLPFPLQCTKVKVKSLSHVRFFATPWTAAYQTPPSLGFSRQEYWNELPLPSPNVYLGPLKITLEKNEYARIHRLQSIVLPTTNNHTPLYLPK